MPSGQFCPSPIPIKIPITPHFTWPPWLYCPFQQLAPFVFEALVPGAYPHPSVSDKKTSYFYSQTLAHFHPAAKRWGDAQSCELQTPQPFLQESSML